MLPLGLRLAPPPWPLPATPPPSQYMHVCVCHTYSSAFVNLKRFCFFRILLLFWPQEMKVVCIIFSYYCYFWPLVCMSSPFWTPLLPRLHHPKHSFVYRMCAPWNYFSFSCLYGYRWSAFITQYKIVIYRTSSYVTRARGAQKGRKQSRIYRQIGTSRHHLWSAASAAGENTSAGIITRNGLTRQLWHISQQFVLSKSANNSALQLLKWNEREITRKQTKTDAHKMWDGRRWWSSWYTAKNIKSSNQSLIFEF